MWYKTKESVILVKFSTQELPICLQKLFDCKFSHFFTLHCRTYQWRKTVKKKKEFKN